MQTARLTPFSSGLRPTLLQFGIGSDFDKGEAKDSWGSRGGKKNPTVKRQPSRLLTSKAILNLVA